MRKRWSESMVNRDEDGRFAVKSVRRGRTPAQTARQLTDLAKIRQEGARAEMYEDRRDKRQRFGRQTDGWWYMTRGPVYWIRRAKKPEMHYGHLYEPSSWAPMVNIGTRRPHWVPSSGAVPKDVWAAAHYYGGPDEGADRKSTATRKASAVRKKAAKTTPRRVTKR